DSSPSQSLTPSLHDALPIFLRIFVKSIFRHIPFIAKIMKHRALALPGLPRNRIQRCSLVPLVPEQLLGAFKNFCLCGFAHGVSRSEEHTSELQSRENLVCRL